MCNHSGGKGGREGGRAKHLPRLAEANRWVVLSLSDFYHRGRQGAGRWAVPASSWPFQGRRRESSPRDLHGPLSLSDWHESVALNDKVCGDVYIGSRPGWQRLAVVFINCPLAVTLCRWSGPNLCRQISSVQKWRLIESLVANAAWYTLYKLAYFVNPSPDNTLIPFSLHPPLQFSLFQCCFSVFLCLQHRVRTKWKWQMWSLSSNNVPLCLFVCVYVCECVRAICVESMDDYDMKCSWALISNSPKVRGISYPHCPLLNDMLMDVQWYPIRSHTAHTHAHIHTQTIHTSTVIGSLFLHVWLTFKLWSLVWNMQRHEEMD